MSRIGRISPSNPPTTGLAVLQNHLADLKQRNAKTAQELRFIDEKITRLAQARDERVRSLNRIRHDLAAAEAGLVVAECDGQR
jgi:predicted  nucleic acid-binding Zn-ribbon protein